ncbi:hypothetical protein C8F01DRAFT_1348937 [Mycena amicta]|nr:hypothetical protein C8F01DRAFT_1348937 [Mycena amicta]
MKLLYLALAALLSFTQLATAAPISYSPGILDIRGTSPLAAPSAQELITLGLIHAPRKDKALFWTGDSQAGALTRLRNVALDLAASQDFDIVTKMLKPQALAFVGPEALRKLTVDQARNVVTDFWDNASEAFAELSTGQVTVMMEEDPSRGPQPEASSVFQRKERPVLAQRLSNGVVTGVDRIGRDFKTTGVRVPFAV